MITKAMHIYTVNINNTETNSSIRAFVLQNTSKSVNENK